MTDIVKPARAINLIVIHCSATPQGQNVTVYDIDTWHAARGFFRSAQACARLNPLLPHIGYHYFIDIPGSLHTGRSLDEIGAHVEGHNANSIGICMAGMTRFAPAQWDALRGLVQSLQTAFPDARICGHRDLSPDLNGDGVIESNEWVKTCPTFDVKTWLIRGMQPQDEYVIKD
jgi:N-acetylmuramoyl-L-alanine amidase